MVLQGLLKPATSSAAFTLTRIERPAEPLAYGGDKVLAPSTNLQRPVDNVMSGGCKSFSKILDLLDLCH